MNPKLLKFEPGMWAGAFLLVTLLILSAGAKNAELSTAKALYKTMASTQRPLQVIDVREDLDEYDDTHIPGSIPFPGCDMAQTAEEVRPFILKSVPTVIISAEGDDETFEKCRVHFTHAQNLAGGIEGWTDELLPEDSGEYVPPKPGAGGGCL
jgi:rhodanese-related sulfurtransferase